MLSSMAGGHAHLGPRANLRVIHGLSEPDSHVEQLGNELDQAVQSGDWTQALPLAQQWLVQGLPVGAPSSSTVSAFNRWFDAFRAIPTAEAELRRVLRTSQDPDVRHLTGNYFSHLAKLGAGPDGREGVTQEETDWYATTAVRLLEQLDHEGRTDVLTDLAGAQAAQLVNFLNHSKIVKDSDLDRLADKPLTTASRDSRPEARAYYELLVNELAAHPQLQAHVDQARSRIASSRTSNSRGLNGLVM